MADNDNRKTPEDIEKELTVGNFAKVQLRTLALVLGGTALGAFAGYATAKWLNVAKAISEWGLVQRGVDLLKKDGIKVSEEAVETAATIATSVVGGMGGSIAGGLAADYEHWAKVEKERLGVLETNKNVSHIMESRVTFEDTLNKQASIIHEMRERLEREQPVRHEAPHHEVAHHETTRHEAVHDTVEHEHKKHFAHEGLRGRHEPKKHESHEKQVVADRAEHNSAERSPT